MKKTSPTAALAAALLGPFAAANAQLAAPRLTAQKADAEQPMQTREMSVHARIRGLHAEVETTLVFHNPNNRQLEGELVFPLPDGAAVSGYALDINGALVDGVVVKKEKARVAFETETRTRVDPGIVEHVRGNVYRTRVYPLPPRGQRTVRLRYVTELASDAQGDVALGLALPRETIGALRIRVQVDNPDMPAPEIGGFGNLRFGRVENTWLAETTLQDTLPGADLFVALPKLPKLVSAVERDAQGDVWFTLSDLPTERPADPPKKHASLQIAWDASRSRADADLDRELAFIEALAKQSGATSFRLLPFRDTPDEPRLFDSFETLRDAIQKLPCDGGTDLNKLAETLLGKDEWYLFTDGLDTLNESLHSPFVIRNLINAVVSQSTADREALRQLCNGNLIDLQRLDTAAAVALALNPPRRVTGVEGTGVADVQGIGAMATGRVMLTGRLTAAEATLRVVYSDGTRSEPVLLNNAAVIPNSQFVIRHSLLGTVWAAGRVTRLSTQAEQNEDELLSLGRRFGLVSPATSLIVLETLEQYVRHEIEPPEQLADMRRQWRARMDNRPKASANNKLERVVAMWRERVAWWEKGGKATELPKPGARLMDAISMVGFGRSIGTRVAGAAEVLETEETEAFRTDGSLDLVAGDAHTYYFRSPNSPLRPAPARETEHYYVKTQSPSSPSASRIAITAWDPKTPYLARIQAGAPEDRYAAYLEEAKTFAASPAFFLDCADYFLQQGDKPVGLRILSNLAELRIEDPALLRVFAWRLQQAGELDRAITLLRRVTRLRPEDPQSWRDLALALAERGKKNGGRTSPSAAAHGDMRPPNDLAEAQKLFLKVILGDWNRTAEIELFCLEELNALMDWIERNAATTADGDVRPPALIDLDPRLRKNLDLDLRIAMSWDADATDIDLHVVEPSGEEAYYGHNHTTIRGHVTHDITDGYGPEAYLLRAAPAGTYAIKANYYGSRQQTVLGPATVTARVFTNWGRENEASQTLTLRLDGVKEAVEIGKITMGNAAAWTAAELSTMRLRAGMAEAEILERLGKPARVDGGEWFYTTGNRDWKFVFENGKLLRAAELLPGNAEMIIVQ